MSGGPMGDGGLNSCWYDARVVHVRHRPQRHRLAYRVPYFWLDLDELPHLFPRSWLFGAERRGLFSFRSLDHFDGRAPVVQRVRAFVVAQGLTDSDCAKVHVLTLCRQWGYVFNPVSFFFCFDATGDFRALLAEVNNTFGERYVYFLSAADTIRRGRWWQHSTAKVMHVSPFARREGAFYQFRWTLPGELLSVHIRECEAGTPVIDATLTGRRRPLNAPTLLAASFRFPWSTAKVTAAIHWEALKLYLKGVPFFHQPPPSQAQRLHEEWWSQQEGPSQTDRERKAKGGSDGAERPSCTPN